MYRNKTAGAPEKKQRGLQPTPDRSRLPLFIPILLTILGFSAALSAFTENEPVSDHYLLMEPIGRAFLSGDFSVLPTILAPEISIQLEAPFAWRGYVQSANSVEVLRQKFIQFQVEKNEWASKQLEGDYAVQSLNLILRHKRSGKQIYYKFIFFLQKKNKNKWEIYFLKGLLI